MCCLLVTAARVLESVGGRPGSLVPSSLSPCCLPPSRLPRASGSLTFAPKRGQISNWAPHGLLSFASSLLVVFLPASSLFHGQGGDSNRHALRHHGNITYLPDLRETLKDILAWLVPGDHWIVGYATTPSPVLAVSDAQRYLSLQREPPRAAKIDPVMVHR